MLTYSKALYQLKLILDYLPEEEYKLIPQEEIDYIEDNFEYDENIVINNSIPLDKQNIDDKTYDLLDKILKKIHYKEKKSTKKDINEYVKKIKSSNEKFDMQMETIKLKDMVKLLKKENNKIPKAKKLLEEYNQALVQKENEIIYLKECNNKLNKDIEKIPNFIRKIFIGG